MGQGERRTRGTAIYPTAALINHECLPNVARTDNFDAADLKAPDNTEVSATLISDLHVANDTGVPRSLGLQVESLFLLFSREKGFV